MKYAVKYGDSPAIIARRFSVPMAALLQANPHKQLAVVAGRRTWQNLRVGEAINVPVRAPGSRPPQHAAAWHQHQEAQRRRIARRAHGLNDGTLGDAITDAIDTIALFGGPCAQGSVGFVCAAQQLLGVTVDGKWGNDTSTAARRYVPSAPAACSPRPSWWAPVGQSSCPAFGPPPAPTTALPLPLPFPIPTSFPTPSPASVSDAVAALATINPCDASNVGLICAAQAVLGVTVDGKYGNDTSAAARALLPNAPPACSPRPAWWAPVGQSNCTTAAAQPLPISVPGIIPATYTAPAPTAAIPDAVSALLQINPCDPSSVALICAAQAVLGVTVDGKYGVDTATAAYRLSPLAPPACSPRPSWWAPIGQSNCGGALPLPVPTPAPTPVIPMPIQVPVPAPAPAPAPAPVPSEDVEVVIPPEKKGVSTAAIVAGGVGATALVGTIAYAAMRKKRRH